MNASSSGQSSAPALNDFILLNEEIAALVRARIPLESHLRKVGGELPAKAGELATRIGGRMSSGESLLTAVDAECASMPAIYRATMAAGVESGRLGGAIESLVDTATRLDGLRRVTGIALLYPLVVVAVASALFALVVTRIIPQFAWLNQSHFGPLALLSRYPHFIEWAAVVVPCLAVLIVAIWWQRSGKLGGLHSARFGILNWMPGSRRVRHWSQAATFAELMLLLVENNVPLDRVLRLMAEATDNGQLRNAALRVADSLQRGEPAWPSDSDDRVQTGKEFPLLIRLALFHSNNRALLTSGLQQAAVLYRERAIRAAEWYAEYVPILLTIGIGGTLTMCFTLAVLWPYASTLRDIARWNWH